jgi:PAS domain S-box-containing protein
MSIPAENPVNPCFSGSYDENSCEPGRSWEWIDSILRSVVDGLLVTDRSSRVLMMNSAAENLLGVSQSTLFDSSLHDFIKDRSLLKRLREAVQNEEDGGRFEIEIGGHCGGMRIVSISTSVHRDRNGIAQGSVFLLRDITRERELDRMKNEFISTAAHELRTPLTAIMGFSELLLTRRDLPSDMQSDFLTFINQKAENLSRIISDLLDISRIEAGRGLELFREFCDINELITETVGSYRTCSEKHSVDVVLSGERILLNVDRGKIIQVMENLLSNAFKYSPQGGAVRVSATPTRGAYLLSVEDEGIGMTREQVRRAFDKFYRGDASNSAVEGTGLGLSITKNIVEAHGGRIWLESRKGKGTTAFITLPMTRELGGEIPSSLDQSFPL